LQRTARAIHHGTSRHFVALRNLVAIEASRTLASRKRGSCIYFANCFIGPASGLIKHNQLTRKTRSDRRTAWNFDRHRQSHTTTVHNGYVPPVLPTSATARLLPRTALLRGVELWLREGAQPVSAARALRTRASERPAVGQRLGPILRPSWPPVLESSPPREPHAEWEGPQNRRQHAIIVVPSLLDPSVVG
jgi:hypothetical protein